MFSARRGDGVNNWGAPKVSTTHDLAMPPAMAGATPCTPAAVRAA